MLGTPDGPDPSRFAALISLAVLGGICDCVHKASPRDVATLQILTQGFSSQQNGQTKIPQPEAEGNLFGTPDGPDSSRFAALIPLRRDLRLRSFPFGGMSLRSRFERSHSPRNDQSTNAIRHSCFGTPDGIRTRDLRRERAMS